MELVLLLLQKPIVPDVYRVIRDSQLIGMCGYSREVKKFYRLFQGW